MVVQKRKCSLDPLFPLAEEPNIKQVVPDEIVYMLL